MTMEKWAPASTHMPALMSGELIVDYCKRLAMERNYKIERRRQELAEQSSGLNPPGRRIRIWEKLHALALPLETAHPLVRLIANSTGLTLEEVQDEQRQRSTAAATETQTARRVIDDPYCVLPGSGRRGIFSTG